MYFQQAAGNGNFFAENAVLIDAILQLLLIIGPLVATWYIRTYVNGTVSEKQVGAIVHLANAAIDYVENMDNRGEFDSLQLPPDFSKGLHKLKLAGEWMEHELKRAGISMSDEEAQTWISSEFQKRMGGVRMVDAIATSARMAVELVQSLEQNGLVTVPSGVDRIFHLAELAADWTVAQLARQGATVPREEALNWVRAELLNLIQMDVDNLPTNERLANLAKQAVAFMQELKENGQLRISGPHAERDVAGGWLLTEAAKQGLLVATDDIATALTAALQQ